MATAADPGVRINGGWSTHLADNLQEQKDEVLALQSIFEGEENRLTVFSVAPEEIPESEDCKENSRFYQLQLQVPVKQDVAKVTLDVCTPIRGPVNSTTQDSNVQNLAALNYKRSDSGNNLLASILISHLTPLNLTVTFPPEYPACGPPQFTLTAIWLSWQQLGALCVMLDKLWEDSPGMPILYTWIDWLENNSLSFLGLRDHVLLQETSPEDIVVDERGMQDCLDIEEAVTIMMRYSTDEENFQFRRTDHECCVCFMEFPGADFYRMKQCGHHICRECMQTLCQIHVKEGTVTELVCPESECKTDIPPGVIREVVGEEQFCRYERLTLQKALDTMGDIVWCPRCQGVVVQESDKTLHLGYCIYCQFSFCTLCKKLWHQGERCVGVEDAVKALEDKLSIKKDDAEEIKRKIERLKEEASSNVYLTNKAKTCPSCHANIQKISGCNKVMCRCGCALCYVCGKDITQTGYEHFNQSRYCSTFTDYEDNDFVWNRRPVPQINPGRVAVMLNIQTRLAENPLLKQVQCPRCHRKNLQGLHGNNHVKCWNCGTGFCFLCREILNKVPVTKHFKPPSPCRQHTVESNHLPGEDDDNS
ncbi:E3 ubiquitin-protein ligase RNF14-like [Ylistrum balloti]|uniref:E3 ubiquitin-protein ligase RNF14-like n=1 Tax=Ylistrum balloti TaxID=509963 RepID=UPI002905B219|nr:E3 ubiquitin-protein ligase RNF14-like [Ylistrum balloti]